MPYKVFTDGNVLTASEVNEFLQQGVLVFDDAAARDAALTPIEGMVAFTKDNNQSRFYDGTNWVLLGGIGNADFTDAASGTYTDGGVDYKWKEYTATGTLTIAEPGGFADILVIGGGGGTRTGSGFISGGGAGGMLELSNVFLPASTLVVTVGGGGSGASQSVANRGNDSLLDTYVAVGGGGGAASGTDGLVRGGDSGGSGSGASANSARFPGKGVTNQGNEGGGVTSGFGAGGGAGGAASGSTPGIGRASSISGTSVTYAKGGASSGTNTANTGDGGQGDNAGNSGIVIIRVRTN